VIPRERPPWDAHVHAKSTHMPTGRDGSVRRARDEPAIERPERAWPVHRRPVVHSPRARGWPRCLSFGQPRRHAPRPIRPARRPDRDPGGQPVPGRALFAPARPGLLLADATTAGGVAPIRAADDAIRTRPSRGGPHRQGGPAGARRRRRGGRVRRSGGGPAPGLPPARVRPAHQLRTDRAGGGARNQGGQGRGDRETAARPSGLRRSVPALGAPAGPRVPGPAQPARARPHPAAAGRAVGRTGPVRRPGSLSRRTVRRAWRGAAGRPWCATGRPGTR
jgi:hypothetical protein